MKTVCQHALLIIFTVPIKQHAVIDVAAALLTAVISFITENAVSVFF